MPACQNNHVYFHRDIMAIWRAVRKRRHNDYTAPLDDAFHRLPPQHHLNASKAVTPSKRIAEASAYLQAS